MTKRLAVQMQEAFNRRAVRRAEATVDPEDFDLEEQERVEQLDAQEHQLHFYVRDRARLVHVVWWCEWLLTDCFAWRVQCVDTISSLFKTHRGAYLQVFEEVLMDKILHVRTVHRRSLRAQLRGHSRLLATPDVRPSVHLRGSEARHLRHRRRAGVW